MYVESTRLLNKVLGESHPQTIDAMANYGRFLHRKQDLPQAEAVLAAVVVANRKARGAQHALIGHDLVNLGLVRLDAGRYDEAVDNLREALEIYARALPGEHPYVASALTGLGRAQLEQGKAREAERTLRQAMQIAVNTLPADSPQVASAKSSLGRALLAQGSSAEAAKLLHDSQPILAQAYGEEAVLTRRTREALLEVNGE
jgi:tetratricopeptide (TPR) repeat protein